MTTRTSVLLCAAACLLVGAACSDDSSNPSADTLPREAGADARVEDGADATISRYTLRVTNGYGGGRYAAGEVVHVFAAVDPHTQLLLRWDGDSTLLDYPAEWHATLTMPARDVDLTAVAEARSFDPQELTFKGSTNVDKLVRYVIPATPVGLILFCHGTGGSSDFLLKDESVAFALAALERGFAVVAFEAEEAAIFRAERAAGTPEAQALEAADLNNDGKIRWRVDTDPNNLDLANLEALFASVGQRWPSLVSVPRYAVGMSNGGAFSVALGALAEVPALASAFPQLRFAAVVSYCASGWAGVSTTTRTPTAWLMCAQDLHPEVGQEGNDEAQASSQAIAANGIGTLFDEHAPSPLYDERFARVEGIDRATSAAIVADLRAAGMLDAASMLTMAPDEIVAAVAADRSSFPTLGALPAGTAPAVRAQLKAVYADHGFYSDWANRTLDFLASP